MFICFHIGLHSLMKSFTNTEPGMGKRHNCVVSLMGWGGYSSEWGLSVTVKYEASGSILFPSAPHIHGELNHSGMEIFEWGCMFSDSEKDLTVWVRVIIIHTVPDYHDLVCNSWRLWLKFCCYIKMFRDCAVQSSRLIQNPIRRLVKFLATIWDELWWRNNCIMIPIAFMFLVARLSINQH